MKQFLTFAGTCLCVLAMANNGWSAVGVQSHETQDLQLPGSHSTAPKTHQSTPLQPNEDLFQKTLGLRCNFNGKDTCSGLINLKNLPEETQNAIKGMDIS